MDEERLYEKLWQQVCEERDAARRDSVAWRAKYDGLHEAMMIVIEKWEKRKAASVDMGAPPM